MRSMTSWLAAAMIVSTVGTASAHPKLVKANPPANAAVSAPATIQLHFSERLLGRFSGAELIMVAMPGMADHPPMRITGAKANVGADGRTLVVTMARPLAAGTYRVDYRVVSDDTHPVKGSHAFRVR